MAAANEFVLRYWPDASAVPSINSFTLNQATDQLEFVFQLREDTVITRGGFRQGTVTGTAPTYLLSLQGVDGSGNPDGVVKGGGSPASTTFSPVAGGNNTWQWKNFANSYSGVRGELLALVISYSSGTVDASNNSSFASSAAGWFFSAQGQPFNIQNDNGVRSRGSSAPVFGYGSAGTAYGRPLSAVITANFSSASTPDEKAVLFTVPATWWSTYQIVGAEIGGNEAAAGAFDLKLYDTDGTTVLQSVSLDTDQFQSTGAMLRRCYFDETTLAALNAGSSYRLAFVPTTGNLNVYGQTVAAAGDLEAFPFGSQASGSTRTDAGAWTDDPLTRYAINPILIDITKGGGGAPPVPLVAPGWAYLEG